MTPRPTLLTKAITIYTAALILFWIVALWGLVARASLFQQPFHLSRLFLANLSHSFDDFTLYDTVLQRFPPSSNLPTVVYPAPLMAVYLLFGLLGTHAFVAYETSIAAVFSAATVYLSSHLRSLVGNRRTLVFVCVIVSCLLCFPFWFQFERGNMEAVVWIIQMIAVAFLLKKRYLMAGILIALGASMKIYPGLLFLVLVSRKQYKALAISILAIIPIQLIGLFVLGPTIHAAYRETNNGLRVLAETHIFNFLDPDIVFDHSLFSLAKQILRFQVVRSHRTHSDISATLLTWGMPYFLGAVSTTLFVYWKRIKNLPVQSQISALLLLSTIFPPMALEYSLIQITIVWALCLMSLADQSSGTDTPMWAVTALMICFAFVFSPGSYLSGYRIGFAGQLKLAALIFALYLVCRFPLTEKSLQGADPNQSE